MSLFIEHISEPVKDGLSKPSAGIPIPMEKLTKYINYIERGKINVVGGKETSGKTSLMDYLYFINLFKWWREQDPQSRPPLKMFYFSMRNSPRIKLQKWLCLYLKLEHDTLMDIPTLNSGVGRLYDLDEDNKHEIIAAMEFFDELEEHMTLISGSQTPSAIYNRVKHYMDSVGSIDDNDKYSLDDEHIGQYTMVYIDNTDKLGTETDGFANMNSDGLKKKLGEYVEEFKNVYNITTSLVVPSRVNNSRMVRDSEPSYKEIGYFAKIADIGLVTYNPFNENNNKYLGYPVEDMMINGKNRFRTITVVRNSTGLENLTVGGIFLGECGYFRESPHPNNEEEFDNFRELLRELP